MNLMEQGISDAHKLVSLEYLKERQCITHSNQDTTVLYKPLVQQWILFPNSVDTQEN